MENCSQIQIKSIEKASHTLKKLSAALLAFIMLFAAACKFGDIDFDVTKAPQQQTQEPTQEPAHEKTAADEAFEAVDHEVFISVVTSSGLTFHQFVKDAASFGIAEEDIERGWGELSQEADAADFAENAEIRKKLSEIDRSQLSYRNRIAYDNLVLNLKLSDEIHAVPDAYYYNEPLTVFNGEHTMLPLMLSMYEISSAEDAENYVLLLEDAPRYIGQIEQFEREKAAKGLFMTENALDKVLESCIKFAETGNDCFLIGFFEDEMASAEFEISEQQKTALLERSRNSIINELLPAYRSLANTLEQLRPQCGSFAGACMRGVDAKDYYAAAIKSNAACNAEYSSMADELSESISSVYAKLVKIILTDSNAMKDYEKNMTSGNVEKDVEYLKELIDGIYPQIPEQSIQYVTIPDAVAEDFSPAAYMISAFDDPTRNVVLLNPTAEDDTMLFTLAHECFPGHLYQTQYFRSLDGLPLSQQLCAPTGYSEGWAVFSELFISGISEKYGVGGCTLREYESVLANILIPAYVSIKVNCEGWTTEDIGDYLKSFGLDQQEYIDVIYEYSIDMPLYFFNYAMGYVYTNKIYESVNHRSDGDKTAFFKRYLNMGPCMFDILFEEFGTEE